MRTGKKKKRWCWIKVVNFINKLHTYYSVLKLEQNERKQKHRRKVHKNGWHDKYCLLKHNRLVSLLRVQGSKEDYKYTWKFFNRWFSSVHPSLFPSWNSVLILITFHLMGAKKISSLVVYFFVVDTAAILQSHFHDEFLLLIFYFAFKKVLFNFFSPSFLYMLLPACY